jgi:hypothetical protein
VAKSPIVTPIFSPPASPEALDHRPRQIDPMNLDAPLRERSAIRPVPIPSSSARPSAGELGKEVDERFEDVGIEQL